MWSVKHWNNNQNIAFDSVVRLMLVSLVVLPPIYANDAANENESFLPLFSCSLLGLPCALPPKQHKNTNCEHFVSLCFKYSYKHWNFSLRLAFAAIHCHILFYWFLFWFLFWFSGFRHSFRCELSFFSFSKAFLLCISTIVDGCQFGLGCTQFAIETLKWWQQSTPYNRIASERVRSRRRPYKKS